MRYNYDVKILQRIKISTKVNVPLNLDLQNCADIDDNSCTEYELVAFLNHFGSSASHGHYKASLRDDAEPNLWIEFNDESVTELDQPGSVTSENVYLVVYKRNDLPSLTREELNIPKALEPYVKSVSRSSPKNTTLRRHLSNDATVIKEHLRRWDIRLSSQKAVIWERYLAEEMNINSLWPMVNLVPSSWWTAVCMGQDYPTLKKFVRPLQELVIHITEDQYPAKLCSAYTEPVKTQSLPVSWFCPHASTSKPGGGIDPIHLYTGFFKIVPSACLPRNVDHEPKWYSAQSSGANYVSPLGNSLEKLGSSTSGLCSPDFEQPNFVASDSSEEPLARRRTLQDTQQQQQPLLNLSVNEFLDFPVPALICQTCALTFDLSAAKNYKVNSAVSTNYRYPYHHHQPITTLGELNGSHTPPTKSSEVATDPT